MADVITNARPNEYRKRARRRRCRRLLTHVPGVTSHARAAIVSSASRRLHAALPSSRIVACRRNERKSQGYRFFLPRDHFRPRPRRGRPTRQGVQDQFSAPLASTSQADSLSPLIARDTFDIARCRHFRSTAPGHRVTPDIAAKSPARAAFSSC